MMENAPMEPASPDLLGAVRPLLPVPLAELVLSGGMLGVYALADAFSTKVLLGAALGTGLAVLNFIAMIFGLLRAEKKDNPMAAQLTSRVLFVLRMAAMLLILVFALKSGRFDPLATLLPLCFMRLALMIPELFRGKGKRSK